MQKIKLVIACGVSLTFIVLMLIMDIRERSIIVSVIEEGESRNMSNYIAEEFKLTSRDLTDRARAYCASENEWFLKEYENIFNWSHGLVPRPNNLNKHIKKWLGTQTTISQNEMIDRILLPDSEKECFILAWQQSDKLAAIEKQAMYALKNGKIDTTGPLAPLENETVNQFIQRALYGDVYQTYIDNIEENINKFASLHEHQSDGILAVYRYLFSKDRVVYYILQMAALIALIYALKQMRKIHRQARIEKERLLFESQTKQAASEKAKEMIQLMLDSIPFGVSIWNCNFENINCNLAMQKLLGISCSEEYSEKFDALSPEYQPDGRESSVAVLELIVAAFETGSQHFEWMHNHVDGTLIPVDVHLVRVDYQDEPVLVSSVRDLREEKELQREIKETSERARFMLDEIPIGCGLFNEKFEMIDCNQVAVRLFQCRDKEDTCKRIFQMFPPTQPDGQTSSVLAIKELSNAFKFGYYQLEWVYQLPSGELMPAEVTAVRGKNGAENVLAVYTRDLREVKKLESSLNKIESIRKATNHAADVLMSFHQGNFENRLTRALRLIANAIKVDKMFIAKNFINGDGQLCFKKVCSHMESPLKCNNNHEYKDGVCYKTALPTFVTRLQKGERITCNIDEIETPDKHFLLCCNSVSVMLVPIFISGEFWGHARLVDCTKKRDFLEGEVEVIRTCGNIFASAIMENETQVRLKKREILASVVNKIAECLMYSQHWNFDKHLTDSMELLGNALNIDRVCISKIHDDYFCDDISDFAIDNIPTQVVYEYTTVKPSILGMQFSSDDIDPLDFSFLKNAIFGGKVVEIHRDECHEKTLKYLEKCQIFSYYGLPIVVEGRFWGMFRLENCHKKQILSSSELEMIDTCSHLFASAFVEYNAKTELAQSNLRLTYESEKAERLGQVKTQFL
ncbi:MAG: GAF domain-containing protein, partial [Thermoguttaceae bacterium]